MEEWLQRDPLILWAKKLEELKVLTPDDRVAVDGEVEKRLDEAVEYARSSPWPDPEDALKDMYTQGYPGLPAKGTSWDAE